MTEDTKPKDGSKSGGVETPQSKPWAFVVVVVAIVGVIVVFLTVWLLPTPKAFAKSSDILAVLTATFGVIGTLVGTYFGIKSAGDARDTVERVQKQQSKPDDRKDTT